jgi:hypothetical protein
MRAGVTLSVSSADRLHALVSDRNAPQKHVWRARIVLLTAEGVGTSAMMRETRKSKTSVWRRQERFADEGFEGLRPVTCRHRRRVRTCLAGVPRHGSLND